ncbi:MAG: hypothetical protein QOF51_2464 [Chloroflexota bacterium]|jgi:hypothetical protein|nr:hypothetical protein [Chloroflexota bacterium]
MFAGYRFTIALEEARRGLDQQQADLNSLRDRAGNLFQFGALSAGFIGAVALRGDADITRWTRGGMWAFAALAVLLVYVLWPRTFTFTNDARPILDHTDWDRPSDEIAEHLARHLENHNQRNQKRLNRMMTGYTAGMFALMAEVGCLLFDVMGR